MPSPSDSFKVEGTRGRLTNSFVPGGENLPTFASQLTYGDGWNGNQLTLTNEGTGETVHVLTQSGDIAKNTTEAFEICFTTGACYEGQVGGGYYTYETSWNIIDGEGTIVVEASSSRSSSFCIPFQTICGEGYQPNANDDGCEACPEGKYSGISGVDVCAPCAMNTYASSSGSAACLPCSVGLISYSGSAACSSGVCFSAYLYDSYGYGWYGNQLTLTNEGTGATVHELTRSGLIDSNTAEAFEVCFPTGACYEGLVGGEDP